MTNHPPRGLAVAALALAIVLTGALIAPADPAVADDASYKEFKRFITSPNSWERVNAIRVLDPNEKKEFEALESVLNAEQWHVRAAAIEVLAGVFDEKLIKDMEKTISKAKSKNAMVADGFILAFGKKGDKRHLPVIREAVANTKLPWQVRRSAAYALGSLPDRESVGSLIEAWKAEKKLREKKSKKWSLQVELRVQESLERITNQFLGPDPVDWENYWIGAKDDFVPGRRDEEAEKLAEEKGFKAKEYVTKERGVELNYRTRGNGPPLFVLPEYGYNRSYLETYLRPLEEYARIFYIDLPAPDKVQGVQAGPGGSPIYPVDQLVEAFEALREAQFKEAKEAGKVAKDKIVIMGHAISCWIAMRYASKYPRNLAGMVLVAPWSGNQAYGAALTRMEGIGNKNKDLELEHYAQSLQIIDQAGNHKYPLETKAREEQLAVGSLKRWSLYFYDYRDSELTMVFFGGIDTTKDPGAGGVVRREVGSAVVPQFDVFKEQKTPAPVVIFCGKNSDFTNIQDCQKIEKHYPNAQLIVMDRVSRMPWMEQNRQFIDIMRKMMK